MLKIALTGGIASGKSAVATLFAERGIDTIDSDDIAREVVSLGKKPLHQIEKKFGHRVLLPSGELNRAALRKIVFNDAESKKWLEALLHPLIRKEIIRQIKETHSPYIIVSIPLFTESTPKKLYDRILLVQASPDIQLERLMSRDKINEDLARKMLENQPDFQHLANVNDIIHNHGDLSSLDKEVAKLHLEYLRLSEK